MTKLSEIKGLKVVDKDKVVIGKVKDADINLINMKLQAIIVHHGFFKHDTKILVDYIDRITKNYLKLNIAPVTRLVGRRVFDSQGTEIGKIKEVTRVGETNILESIVVRAKVKLTRERGVFTERATPGERRPMGVTTYQFGVPVSRPSGEVEVEMPRSDIETVTKDVTISSKDIESMGKTIILKKAKEEIIH